MSEVKKCGICEASALIGVGIAICKVARGEASAQKSPCTDVVEDFKSKRIDAKEAIKRLYSMAKEGKLDPRAQEFMEQAMKRVEE